MQFRHSGFSKIKVFDYPQRAVGLRLYEVAGREEKNG